MLKSVISAALLMLAAPSLAQDDPLPSETVRHADLDLTSTQGRIAFARRLNGAVRRVCPGGDSYFLAVRMAARRCVQETGAVVQGQYALAVARAQARASSTRLAAR